jgi:hypothetical protein
MKTWRVFGLVWLAGQLAIFGGAAAFYALRGDLNLRNYGNGLFVLSAIFFVVGTMVLYGQSAYGANPLMRYIETTTDNTIRDIERRRWQDRQVGMNFGVQAALIAFPPFCISIAMALLMM